MKPEPLTAMATSTPQSILLEQYARGLARSGQRNLSGTRGTIWVRYDDIAMMRIPQFYLEPPLTGEVRRVLWQGPTALASYNLYPDESHPANSWLYACTDHAYGLDKLVPAMRRNVKRGLAELRIGLVTGEQLMAYGAQSFRDTLRRNGLRDSTPEEFRRQIVTRAKCPGHVFLGAWKGERLAAYLAIVDVDDWVEITCGFSADDLLHFRPNDALLFSALSHYLVEKRRRIVTFGSSSIQLESNKAGLHAFKTKVGFKAQPVHRVFVLHPVLRLFANRFALWGMARAQQLVPGQRYLKKAEGILAYMLGKNKNTGGKVHQD